MKGRIASAGGSARQGPAILEAGFRPFFFLALLFAVLILPLWLLVFQGHLGLGGPFGPLDWHAHELIFGYGAAALTGFLLTAIPNWTGRLPVRGPALAVLAGLWLLGRLAAFGLLGSHSGLALVADSAFLLAVGLVTAREIAAGRNWRNLKVVVPVFTLFAANLLSHLEARGGGSVEYGERLGLSVLLFLIMLIGGRIIPSFTRNWLVKRGESALPRPFGRYDAGSLAIGGAALLAWTALPQSPLAGSLLVLAAAAHALRLARWRGWRVLASPLLAVLHVGYGFLPLGLAMVGAGERLAGLHLLGVGAVGGMTAAVMARATLGHTGRALESGSLLNTAFAALFLSALVRAATVFWPGAGLEMLHLSGGLWTLAFGLLLAGLGAALWRRRTPAAQA